MVVCGSHTPVTKCKFSPCIWTWKLRDTATASQFQLAFKVKTMTAAAAVATTAGADVDPVNYIESAWSKLKGPLLDAATKVCCLCKNHQWKSKTWWWNEQMDEATSIQIPQCPGEGRHNGGGQGGKNCLHRCQSHGKACHLAGKVWGGERGACAHWQRQDEGMGWVLC